MSLLQLVANGRPIFDGIDEYYVSTKHNYQFENNQCSIEITYDLCEPKKIMCYECDDEFSVVNIC